MKKKIEKKERKIEQKKKKANSHFGDPSGWWHRRQSSRQLFVVKMSNV